MKKNIREEKKYRKKKKKGMETICVWNAMV